MTSGAVGESPPSESASATSNKVNGKPTANNISPALVSIRASARKIEAMGRVRVMNQQACEYRAKREHAPRVGALCRTRNALKRL
jgi:hypothetical protein